MTNLKKSFAVLAALLLLSACQTEDVSPDTSHLKGVELTQNNVFYPKPTLPPPILQPAPYSASLSAEFTLRMNTAHEETNYTLSPFNQSVTVVSGPQEIQTNLNALQVNLAQPFIDRIIQLNSTYEVRAEAMAFERQVRSGMLSDDDKLMLLSISSSVIAAADFIDDGGALEIQKTVARQLNLPEPSQVNCVNVKDIMRNAVVTGTAGAISGSIAGAMGGTVTIPGVGTVSGAVGGGVLGFASGFFGTVTYGVVTDYLFKCLTRRDKAMPCTADTFACKQEQIEAFLREGRLLLVVKPA